ncbi:AbrB/MazE/SpoVT family DNA-binding domain-containing protein [Levilactobacillus mulengensis]|uniref:AbrB/MazE/SpoVT family DNA-binding domain-containing protein n=1 Tax=Levilactobacillus mulengensis TaxID=2486025 RepID=UPI000F79BBF8|nr:AbrB/MazE/SpoVT family DNA-binding domain-containing protein [Levilactobacillus mulengensis]
MEKIKRDLVNRTFEVKVSPKGQIVIPADIRKKINLTGGNTLQVSLTENDEISIKKTPTALDWANLVAEGSVEKVEFKPDGTVDAAKSPNFAAWMAEDDE